MSLSTIGSLRVELGSWSLKNKEELYVVDTSEFGVSFEFN
jgi:hypothetical protein